MGQLTNDRLLSSRMRVTTGSENLKKPKHTRLLEPKTRTTKYSSPCLRELRCYYDSIIFLRPHCEIGCSLYVIKVIEIVFR